MIGCSQGISIQVHLDKGYIMKGSIFPTRLRLGVVITLLHCQLSQDHRAVHVTYIHSHTRYGSSFSRADYITTIWLSSCAPSYTKRTRTWEWGRYYSTEPYKIHNRYITHGTKNWWWHWDLTFELSGGCRNYWQCFTKNKHLSTGWYPVVYFKIYYFH